MVGRHILDWVAENLRKDRPNKTSEGEDADTRQYPGKKITDHEFYKG